MKRTRAIVRYILSGILLLLILLLGISSLVYSPEFVVRVLRWGDADVYDYQKFPERELVPSTEPFEFSYSLEENQVRAAFEQLAGQNNFDAFLEKNRTQAFIVIQEDAVIYEQYFNGASRDSIVTSFSIAKSFTSALVGIAISEGHIQSVDDPITDYLPELTERDPDFANITIRDLLLMSSGIKYTEPPDDALTYYHPNLRALALERTWITGSPGDHFLYNNFHPLLLGIILERATGTTISSFLQEKIWQPIGITYPGSWSLDESGFEKMESGINTRAIDFAKFGRLFLKDGQWNGTQVVPSTWVAESTRPMEVANYQSYYENDFIFSDGSGYYQYMWWGIRRDGGGYDLIAMGNHGQFIYLSSEKDLMILRFGESYGEYRGAAGWIEIFHDFATDW